MNYKEFQTLNETAKRIAEQAHENQKYDNQPYIRHLEHVHRILLKFGYAVSEHNFNEENAKILISGWLHDVLEDTVLEKKHLIYHFGEEISEIVWRVTDEPGKNRKERKSKTYPKIKADHRSLVVKLADRIANMEAALEVKRLKNIDKFYKMYQKEHIDFYKNLYNKEPNLEPMWDYLSSLAKDK